MRCKSPPLFKDTYCWRLASALYFAEPQLGWAKKKGKKEQATRPVTGIGGSLSWRLSVKIKVLCSRTIARLKIIIRTIRVRLILKVASIGSMLGLMRVEKVENSSVYRSKQSSQDLRWSAAGRGIQMMIFNSNDSP